MQAYMHKILNEFENQIDSIKSDGVIALCCIIIISILVNTITSGKYWSIFMKLCMLAYISLWIQEQLNMFPQRVYIFFELLSFSSTITAISVKIFLF